MAHRDHAVDAIGQRAIDLALQVLHARHQPFHAIAIVRVVDRSNLALIGHPEVIDVHLRVLVNRLADGVAGEVVAIQAIAAGPRVGYGIAVIAAVHGNEALDRALLFVLPDLAPHDFLELRVRVLAVEQPPAPRVDAEASPHGAAGISEPAPHARVLADALL